MAEIFVKNRVCAACGADVRPQALFCYNCGETVAAEAAENVIPIENHIDDSRPKEKLEKNGNEVKEDIISKSDSKRPKLRVVAQNKFEEKEVELRSAASLRNKSKRIEPKKVEIIWEERENAPNIWFLAAAIFLVIFSVVIFFIAMYLK